MALALHSVTEFTFPMKLQQLPRTFIRQSHYQMQVIASVEKTNFVPVPSVSWFKPRRHTKNIRWSRLPSATDSNMDISELKDSSAEIAVGNNQTPSSNSQSNASEGDGNSSSQAPSVTPKRSPLTAREKLRAARVLSRYTISEPSKSEAGSRVLDALRESDRGKKRSGLPEAPSNLFDDSKRGMPKQGLTFSFPGGTDLFIIISSFIFISTVMFTTTYIVWKSGAIHFNEY